MNPFVLNYELFTFVEYNLLSRFKENWNRTRKQDSTERAEQVRFNSKKEVQLRTNLVLLI